MNTSELWKRRKEVVLRDVPIGDLRNALADAINNLTMGVAAHPRALRDLRDILDVSWYSDTDTAAKCLCVLGWAEDAVSGESP